MPAELMVFEPGVMEGYQWVLPIDNADFEAFRALSAEREASRWGPIRVRLLNADENERLAEADMPWLGSHVLVLRKRAVEVLGDLIASDAELLPLECEDAELWLVHVWRVIDALDEERSSVVRFPSTGRILKVRQPTFRSYQLNGVQCFRIPQLLRGPMYVTEAVVNAAEAAGLTGVRFRPVSNVD